ncbi:leucine--tRNA ligase [Thermobispora bispora]|uniref:Leucine--tRNA ligase n=1 Tax=Thermobispora bispora (strain ATCC 19993 / DSM 43833 / CBS 139.67 / JCM 10125 / KCTC 9307 / NBRC 14880 / R51) TaxID=469371 RepID=D6Y430_THEBD|nr:leucine--tRNA ligase [Thermobispora bispora]MBO2474315.1 leucine--tRNA ligase [Actinomycetales bacterium]MDI9579763.1 leucine--tRNA ligase [Thermobispora sp.]ADG89132.1 leucyl-tRNA synthetase [Thermobispora bispora DSM 43833]MBX6168003.1 leucine--tRNA ligase [Thermobispora bispora]QSI48846.1 leucine--tRNA ligase [Thermobispora bispora]
MDDQVYDPQALQAKWLPRWEELNTFAAVEDPADPRPRRYMLDMFPYPSGDLHMGHGEAFAIGDVVARYWFQKGYNVLHPIGWDSFGLPAENAAIKRNAHPAEWTYANIDTQARSFKQYATSFDWSRRLHTSDPEYYRWNQWLFLRFYERGLAYRKDGLVNWCPKDQTVLANEQVINGRCERCQSEVVRRKLTQWYFKITEYADRLLDDMKQLEGKWPERVLTMQRNWIGRSTGADVQFKIEGREEPVTVFTTRPDTLYGATFFVVAPDSPLADEIVAPDRREALARYKAEVAKLSDIERLSTEKEKTGVFLGVYAINPVNGERLPVWAADYVLSDYGHGAIMAVPAHDQRDLDFALKFGLPVRVVVDTGEPDPAETGIATPGEGKLINSGPLNGLSKAEAIQKMIEILTENGTGKAAVNYRLRDWLVSRQRYWGTPIPIIHCPSCGEVPVPDDQLPVTLPDLRGEALAPKGVSPLASAEEWVNVDCPKCGGPAKRDTDTMDTFVDSSWYFLRYCDPDYEDGPFNVEKVRTWCPVDQYVGGVEHAVLHLLYSRFFTKVLYDMGLVDFTEPFQRLLNQGQVINQGKAMSKSLGNGVDLGEQIEKYGVDAVRLTMVFAGPPEDDIDWADVSPAASQKFLARALRVMTEAGAASAPGVDFSKGDVALRKVTHRVIDEVTKLVEAYRFNVAVARMMELTTAIRRAIDSGPGAADPAVREAAETLAIMLSLVAPYTAEEGWERLGHKPSVAKAGWPEADPQLLVQESVTCVVQVGGKLRDRLTVPPDISEAELERLALASEKVQRYLSGAPRKVIIRAPKLINIVP